MSDLTPATPATHLLAGASLQLDFISPLQSGLFAGCAYGLLALGIVLLYKSNRILNFAQGEFAGVSLIVAFCFNTGYHSKSLTFITFPKLPYVPSVLLGVATAVLVGVLTQLIVIRPLFNQPRVVLVVATIGVSLFLIGIEGLFFPEIGSFKSAAAALGQSDSAFRIDQVVILWPDIIRLVVLVALAIGALLFFKATPTGTAVLAVSQDSTASSVVGIDVQKVSLTTWALAGFLGGIAGVLPIGTVASTTTPGVFTGIVLVSAFTAAVLGGITSLPGAFAGGILLGIVQAFSDAEAHNIPGLDQLKGGQGELIVLVLLLGVLVFRPTGLLGKEV